MRYKIIKELPSSADWIGACPLSLAAQQKVLEDRQAVQAILSGHDPRLLMIVGPCSAWPQEAVLEYAKRLLALNPKVAHALKLVMRVYIQKPRTITGWMGPVNQPDPFAYPDIEKGTYYARKMMCAVVEMGLPIADEALFTHNSKGFAELLSWVAIGARSSEDPEHRIFASSLGCPVGLKNPTSGILETAVNSIVAAQHGHVAVLEGCEVETFGNPYAHLVLRGGNKKPNYDNGALWEAKKHMDKHNIANPAIVVDVSHDNCKVDGKKECTRQGDVIFKILNNIAQEKALQKLVRGFMVESFMKEGNQKLLPDQPDLLDRGGLSITDPCLGWESTQAMLLALAEKVAACRL